MEVCQICGMPKQKEIEMPLFDGSGRTEKKIVRVSCRCDVEKEKKQQEKLDAESRMREIAELKRLSLIDEKLIRARFDECKTTDDNKEAVALAKRYVSKFDELYEKNQGLLFWGDVGTGKSYIAACIANALLENGVPVVMTSFVKLLAGAHEFKEDMASRLGKAKLLVIDDLGAERGTDFSLEKVYDIVDTRYRSGKPLILTTNMSLNEMMSCRDIRYSRIYDRIFEMCYPVHMSGLSWRKREAASRHDEMRRLLE